jgi:hypothetical protein
VAATGSGHRPRHAATGAAAARPRPPETRGFRLAAAVNADGRPELFAVSPGGSLMHLDYSRGAWAGWAVLAGPGLPGGGLTFAGVPAVVRDGTGRLEVFARTTGGTIACLWQATPGDGSWEGPTELGFGNVTSDPSVIAWPGTSRLDVFARLGDGSAGHDWQAEPGGAWSGWESLGGSLGGPPVASVNADGRPEVFAIGSDGSLVHDYYWQGAWSGWAVLAGPGLPGGNEFTGVPAVGENTDGRLEVFVRTTGGDLEHVWQAAPSAGPWDGPGVLGSGVSSDPAVFGGNGGQLEVFAGLGHGTIGSIGQLQADGGTGWSNWASLGGSADSAPGVVGAYGGVDVFARAAGGGIGEIQWTGAAGWSGWSRLGGSF